jgi:hypothetical protein
MHASTGPDKISIRVTWPSGKAEVRMTFYEGSNPSVTAIATMVRP